MGYKLWKAFHLVAVISWMAGILYLYRLIIYFIVDKEPVVRARLQIMQRRLYRGITLPAMICAIGAGTAMIVTDPSLLKMHWLHAKLGFVALLIGSTIYAGRTIRRQAAGQEVASERHFRVANEVPTLLMILIVLLVVLQPF
jgi:putative membrane protein